MQIISADKLCLLDQAIEKCSSEHKYLEICPQHLCSVGLVLILIIGTRGKLSHIPSLGMIGENPSKNIKTEPCLFF